MKAIITRNDQTAVLELPTSRMELAGSLSRIGAPPALLRGHRDAPPSNCRMGKYQFCVALSYLINMHYFWNYYNFCLNFGVHFNCTVAFALRIYSQTVFSRFFQKALDKPSALCYNRDVVRKKPVAAVFERARRCFCRCGGIGRRPGLKIP